MLAYHLVVFISRADYTLLKLPPREDWAGRIEPGGKYFVTRNGSSTIAFTVGKAYKPGNGVAIVAGHIDALTARVKPVSKKPTAAGYVQLGVAPYAGALNETWWDRDLSIGGRVIVRDDSGKTSSKLVKLDWPSKRYFVMCLESLTNSLKSLGYRPWLLISESVCWAITTRKLRQYL